MISERKRGHQLASTLHMSIISENKREKPHYTDLILAHYQSTWENKLIYPIHSIGTGQIKYQTV